MGFGDGRTVSFDNRQETSRVNGLRFGGIRANSCSASGSPTLVCCPVCGASTRQLPGWGVASSAWSDTL